MARTKNRGLQQSFSPSYTVRRWRLGEYIRLSKEDLKKGKDDSNSVINQRDLLNDFYQKHIGEFESVSEYVDDGHTGTDANRENFQRLLSDVMSGKINCVVVKDLSRFARNYSDAGSLIDNLFVQMGVRFISLAENVDSYLNPDSVSSIIVPITNVMNDQYCYQTSKKIRQVFDYKRRNGQYIGAFAPYGYVKHPKDKHQLIIDPDAAEIVKLVFSLFLKGTSKRAIALYLNEHGVPSPSAYKLQKGIPVSTRGYDDPMWGARMIHSILTNPTYTGDLAQGRSRVKSYKVHEVESVPREEWVEVAGTPNTVIHYHAVIHSALKYAVKTDMLIQNVADKVDRPRKNSFQPVFLSADEMQKMFEALRGTKLELPVLVAAFYGLRRGEVVGLKWDAIDFEQGTISVKRTVTSTIIDGKYQEFEQQSAKTKSSLRTLPLIGSFREYFMQVKEAQELNKQVCGNCYNYEYDGFVFVDELGERMRVEYLTNAFPKFLESHGLRRMRFHDLRHSCASLLLANGVPLKHIQEWLGHSDFTTTANIYAHLDYKSKITSAQAMETGLALPEGGDFSSRWSSISAGENS